MLINAQRLGNGKKPIVVDTEDERRIVSQVGKVSSDGCVVLVFKIVRAKDGTCLSTTAWERIVKACQKHSLILVVDEALTAIRYGSPFACQSDRYQRHGHPDFILFNKAIKTHGIAVDWEGVNVS